MNSLRFTLLALLLTSWWSPSQAAPDCLPAPSGLSVWFRLEDNVQDHLSSLTGVLPPSATFAPGKVGKGIVLDGVAGAVLPQDSRFDRGSFTLEAWVRRADTQRASQSISGSGVIFAGGRASYSLTMENTGQMYISHVAIQNYYFGSGITDLEWHHVSLTRTGPTFRLRLDGQPAGEVNVPGFILTSGPFAIGSLAESIDQQVYAFWGTLDEVSFYPRELAESEVQALFEAGVQGKGKCTDVVLGPDCEPAPAGIVAWFPLDEDGRNLLSPGNPGGPSAATFGPGTVRGAAFFDGRTPGIVLPDDPKLKSQNFTVEAWIQRASTSAASHSPIPNGAIFSGGDRSYFLAMAADGGLYFGRIGGGNFPSSGYVVDTAWHHVAMTKSGGIVSIFVDGIVTGSQDVGGEPLDLSTPFAIGSLSAPYGGENYTFLGGIDELSFYDRPLVADEVFRIWARGAAGKCFGGLELTFQVPSEVVEGSSFDYTLTVFNRGTNAVTGVVVTNSVPAGFQVTLAQAGTGSATILAGEQGSQVVFNPGDLAAGTPATVRVSLSNAPLGLQRLGAVALHSGEAGPVSASASLLVRPVCGPVPGGLATWWKGESNTLEQIFGSMGGLSNGVSYVEGRIGSAFRFDGQNGTGVNVGPLAALQRSEFSIEAWLRRESATTAVLSGTSATILGAGTDGWYFALLNDGALTFGRTDGPSVSTPPAITDLAWHHVAVTRGPNEVRFYKDGQLVSAQSFTQSFNLNQDYGLGAVFPSGGNNFFGNLDEIAFYGRVLSAEEILSIAGAGGAPKCVEDLVLSSTSGGPIPLGEDWEVLYTISSLGSQPSTQVTFSNAIPPGLLFLSASASQGTIENLAGVLRGDLGTIPAGSNGVVRVLLRPLVGGNYSLLASTGRAENELSLSNNHLNLQANALALAVGLEGDVTVTEPAVAEFSVVLNAPVAKVVTVDYATVAGTASAVADFEPQSGRLEFPPGVTRQTIRVPVIADGLYELDESFSVVLSQAVNAALSTATALGNIISPDPLPLVSVRPILSAEGNSGTTLYRFEVALDRPSGLAASVRYATTNDSAKAPTDYAAQEGLIQFAPGETNAGVEVTVYGDTAVEPNEIFFLTFSGPQGLRFPSTIPAPAVGTIVNDDAISGQVTGFTWGNLPDGVTVGEAFPAQLTAHDGVGGPVPGFNGVVGLQAFAGPGRPSSVLLTEVLVATSRGAELQNVSPEPVDVSGWTVYFYDGRQWPAPRVTFTIPNGTMVTPSAVFVVDVAGSSGSSGVFPRFRQAGSLLWGGPSPVNPVSIVGVVVADATGQIQDAFFAGDAIPAEVGVPAVLTGDDWFGPSVSALAEGIGYRRPPGQSRNARRATDWQEATFATASMGRGNPGLVLPFADAIPVAMTPDATPAFSGGVWAGNLTLDGFAPEVRFLADDGNGHRGLSPSRPVRVLDDLTVAMTASPLVLTAPSWSTDFVINVTNLGPVLSSNVTARVLLSSRYGTPFNSLPVPPQVSQGTVSVGTVAAPGGIRAEVTARFGDLPSGGVATLTFSAMRSAVSGVRLPETLESTVALTRDPVELNLLNNTATVVQELSRSCAPLGDAVTAWWRADGSFADSLAGLTGTPAGGAGLGEARVGTGGFHFDGVDDAFTVPDADPLDVGASDSFTWEAWLRVPVGAPASVALMDKSQSSGATLTGYSFGLLDGRLSWAMGDGVNLHRWKGLPETGDLRDGAWHHVVVTLERRPNGQNGTGVAAWLDRQPVVGLLQTLLKTGSLANDAPLRFGDAVPDLWEKPFSGDLDEVVFYRRAVTAREVQLTYEASAHGHCLSEFELTPVAPRFTVTELQWIALDAGVAGRPYRFDFTLLNRGPLAADAAFRVVPFSEVSQLVLVTPDGTVPFDPEMSQVLAPLGSVPPGGAVPLAVALVSTNPLVDLLLIGAAPGLSYPPGSMSVQIDLAADTDGDGIPDAVELAVGLNPASAADAGSDTDGDGFTAAQEFEAGTAANSATSVLRLRVVEGQVVFDALASRVYRLERSDTLGAGPWTLIQELRPETDGVLSLGSLPGDDGSGYYRVVASLPY